MLKNKRKISSKVSAVGEWGIRTIGGIVVDHLSEASAWDMFLHQVVDPDAELIFRDKVMARRTPVIPEPIKPSSFNDEEKMIFDSEIEVENFINERFKETK